MHVSIQLCTYKRAHLIGRVLEACFEQDYPSADYEVVLVNDGSPDDTAAVIERMRARADCGFTAIEQPNAGLAKARNAGLRLVRGEIVIFIDDDVIPMPGFVREHARSHAERPRSVVRGAVINTKSPDELPPPVYTLANYSGNFFWTTNVSVPKRELDAAGWFDESFAEYGWEDIELGMRLRHAGVRGVFNKRALAFHVKPPPTGADVAGMVRQARAQARTAVRLGELQPHWRVALATGNLRPQRGWHRALRALGGQQLLERVAAAAPEQHLPAVRRLAAAALAREAYFEELDRTIADRT